MSSDTDDAHEDLLHLQSVKHHVMDSEEKDPPQTAAATHSLQSQCVCRFTGRIITCYLCSYVSICRCEVSLSLWRTERDLHLLITAVCL